MPKFGRRERCFYAILLLVALDTVLPIVVSALTLAEPGSMRITADVWSSVFWIAGAFIVGDTARPSGSTWTRGVGKGEPEPAEDSSEPL